VLSNCYQVRIRTAVIDVGAGNLRRGSGRVMNRRRTDDSS
jgi:hypothetical protein